MTLMALMSIVALERNGLLEHGDAGTRASEVWSQIGQGKDVLWNHGDMHPHADLHGALLLSTPATPGTYSTDPNDPNVL